MSLDERRQHEFDLVLKQMLGEGREQLIVAGTLEVQKSASLSGQEVGAEGALHVVVPVLDLSNYILSTFFFSILNLFCEVTI